LRRKTHQSKEYRFMGQCYLDGWMYGDNPRNYRWWEKEGGVWDKNECMGEICTKTCCAQMETLTREEGKVIVEDWDGELCEQ